MNHEGYEKRLSLVKNALREHGLKAIDITPLEYDENCPFPYNNFIYKITLAQPATADNFKATRTPRTTLPPEGGVSALVMRLGNLAAEGLNQANRVENEVAALHLARQGLGAATGRPELSAVVPAVYDWRRAAGAQPGWILMDHVPGTSLDRHFGTLKPAEQQDVLAQLADILAGLQRVPLPASVTAYGGLRIGDEGEIVGGQMTTLKGGPWGTYGDLVRARLHSQLGGADGSEVLQGWRQNGVRGRVDAFLDSRLEKALEEAGVDMTALALVHGDLTLSNVLFDAATKRITGLVDFDFASVCHPSQEFFTSFHDFGGDALADGSPAGDMWESAMAARHLTRPSTIKGMDAIKLVYKLESLLCPFRLVHPVFVKKKTQEQITEERAKTEAALMECLAVLGS